MERTNNLSERKNHHPKHGVVRRALAAAAFGLEKIMPKPKLKFGDPGYRPGYRVDEEEWNVTPSEIPTADMYKAFKKLEQYERDVLAARAKKRASGEQ